MVWNTDPITQAYGVNGEQGVDFGNAFHTPITALFGGTVVEAQRTNWGNGLSSGGLVEILTNLQGKGQEGSYYLHLDTIDPGVKVGSHVDVGQLLGLSGGQLYGGNWPTSRAYSDGPHTEFGFGANFLADKTGSNFNPASYVTGKGGAGNTGSAAGSGRCGDRLRPGSLRQRCRPSSR